MKGKPKHLSLRIDEDLLRKFEYVAKYDDRSMNWYLLHLIKNEIAELRDDGEILLMKEVCADCLHKFKITQKFDF